MIKRYIQTADIDGTNKLFQTPESFVSGSVWVFKAGSSTTLLAIQEIGDDYFTTSTAPQVGDKLYVIYETEDSSELVDEGLSPWDKEAVTKLLEVVKSQKETIDLIYDALNNRVTKEDFANWAKVVEGKIDNKLALL